MNSLGTWVRPPARETEPRTPKQASVRQAQIGDVGTPEARIPERETPSAKLQTQNTKHKTQNPKPETRNTQHETRNRKPETRNPEPEIRNPEPES